MVDWRGAAALFVLFSAALEAVDGESKYSSPYYQPQYNTFNHNPADLYGQYREFAKSEDAGLFTEIFNLATKAIITTNATCGRDGPESYCKLVEHVYMRMPQCDICDPNNADKSHPITNAIDGTNRWWQSPSLSQGLEYEWVTITLDLRQHYQVAYVIVKSAIAPRPGTWVLERSLDGVTYMPWQYFVTDDYECMRTFGMPATVGVPRFKTDDEVHCTSFFSKLDPIENGEVHTSLVNGRPGIHGPSVALQQFTRARYVRLRLQHLRTLNADLMVISRRVNTTSRIDQSVTRRYFYAIKDISIGGQCICYGHAERCPSDPVTGQLRCECRHNTCGESCDICCPLFNQLPWRQGTNTENNVCQACQCHSHATECVYDAEIERLGLSVTPEGIFEGGGKCIDCMHNTEGINCEKCKPLYFRPSGVSHYREDACRPCDCDLLGSVDGNCIRDDTSAVNNLKPGDCVCKPGFGGRRCERCAPGYRNYPTCEPCPCNQAGSVNFDTCEEDSCVCKANVEGVHCDRCKPGTINLDVMNPQGCQPCFCFGVSETCSEYPWGKGEIRQMLGWKLTDSYAQRVVAPTQESGDFLMFNANDSEHRSLYYWKAPKDFTGNLLNSYAGTLQYYVYFVPGKTGQVVGQADVVIEGNGIKIEHYSQQQFFGRENISMHVKMHESDRWYNSQTRRPVDKREFMRALSDVDLFLVRAIYHQEQVQSSIYGLSLDVATADSNSEHKMKSVEKCECPDRFTGNSCESCVTGYRRVNDLLYQGTCEKCECQDHSETCDPFTGHCLECQHNTAGRRCENCIAGHYGNPSLGGSLGACRPCGCPLTNPENNFSPTCSLATLVSGGGGPSTTDDYVCTACESGYQGNKCEMCADGYFGDPTAVNGSCEVCDCNGNVDPMAIGNCDSTTGHCLKCIGYTTGEHCELCLDNHYGSAIAHSCHPCNCHVRGSVAPSCDNATGVCECNEFYEGKQCSQCVEGHGDIENGCPACACDATGSTDSTQCNEVSGQCSCKQGVFGKHCDSCRTGYFNFTDRGCQFCQCNVDGSVDDGSCNNVTGQCICREHVEGTSCSECEKGYFNITSGSGCQACDCDDIGADGDECDLRTGQCRCRPGVSGVKCDKCAPNHYGLDETGCKQCQKCPAPGHVCDSVTGDCVCPPYTVGEMCENCTENAWNHHPLKGCQPCECNSEGSVGASCDRYTGQCTCRDEYVGLKCDMCTHGHFNFPTCEKCLCDVAGTDPSSCNNDGVCLCDDKGQCPCKKNVQGPKCDQCTAQSFSLEKANPAGCTDCFCFGHTNFCVQSSYVWQQIYAEDRRAVFEQPWEYYTEKHGLRILKEYPARFNSYPTDATPLYWPLPQHLLGDRIASYNGFIRFKISNDDNRRGISPVRPEDQYFRYYPMVVLVGNQRIILEYFADKIADDGKYRVRLREDLWRSRSSPEIPVSRKQLMIALQNVQSIYIRGTYNYHGERDVASISEVSLDVAVWDNTTDVVNTTAIGVETCGDCPAGYTGMSCQNPAEGYCRKRKPDYLNSEDDSALTGYAEPCSCSGHSTTCEAETCRCTNCDHNTFGDRCQYCKQGYYGDARDGEPDDCKKCACPLVDNSFSETCRSVPDGRGYVCDACKPGYTGMYCESCIDGYFGNPNATGGFCNQCDCHPDGSLNGRCDRVTGQCQCRPGVTGRDCSMCQARHAFMGGVCTSCDQGCTKELMTMVDELEAELSKQNFTGLVPIPWKRLNNTDTATADLRNFLEGIKTGESGAKELISDLGDESKYLADAQGVVDQAKFVLDRINKSHGTVNKLITDANDLDSLSNNIHYKATEIINQLKHFTSFGGGKRPSATVETWLVEAREHLEQTKNRDVHIDKRYNRATVEVEKAKELLKKILSRKLNDTSFDILRDQLKKFRDFVEDYRNTIWDEARGHTISAGKISQVSEKSLNQYKKVLATINDLLAEANDALTESQNSVSGAKNEMLLNMFDDYKGANDTLLPALEEATEKAQKLADQHSQLTNEYRVKYVQQSQIHADKLQLDAARLQNSFGSTKLAAEKPIAASNAHTDIVDALKNASDASVAAQKAADAAFELASSDSDDSMVVMAEQSLNVSMALLKEAGELSVADLEKERDGYKTRLGNVNEDIIAGRKREDATRDHYQSFDDQHDRMSGVIDVAQNAENRATETKNEVDKLAADIDAMNQRVSKLTEFTGHGIRDVTDKVREAGVEVASARERLRSVQAQASENDALVNTLGEDLIILKEKIKEAREKASRIRIAVKGPEENARFCRRSFLSPASPTPSNVVSVKYRPVRDVYDSLIFITKTKSRRTQPSEHLALELRQQRIVFHWNIGGGNRMITNTFPITYIPQSARNTWYHIDVKRKGDSAMLTVAKKETLPGDESKDVDAEPIAVEHAFQGNGEVIFNTQPGETTISLGSEADLSALSALGIETVDFHGVVGELTMDEQSLPLWGFSESNDQCQGAVSPATASSTSGHMFRDGYAEVQMSLTERPTDSMITVFFTAYSPDGLIYFRGSQDNGDFISLELRNGSVVFKFYLGGESSAVVQSKKKSYNDGRTHTIRAIRNKQEGALQVDSESDRVTSEAPGKNSALNVGDGNHFVGGVPASFNISKWERFDIHWRGFFGCISSVKPSQFNELDLDNPVRSQRKQPGCLMDADRLHTTDRVIGFPHPGYFVVSGISMSTNSSLAFDFRTREPNATLLFQSSRLATYHRREREASEGQGYLAFYLYQGYLVAHLGTDAAQRSKLVTLRTDAKLNDGHLHAVFLARDGETISLMVNDRLVANGSLSELAVIGSARAQMFIGGFPDKVKPSSNEIPLSVPLIGCISDIYLNFKRVPLIPEVHNATIGMCKEDDTVKAATDAQAEEPLQADAGGDSERTADRLSVHLAAPTVEVRNSILFGNGPFSAHSIGSNLLLARPPPPPEPETTEEPTEEPTETPTEETWTTTEPTDPPPSCLAPPIRPIKPGEPTERPFAARFGVSEVSHSRLNFPNKDTAPNYESFSLSFWFRTSKPSGTLWVWANYNNYTRYFNMSLADGYLELAIKNHKHPKVLRVKEGRLDDNVWHLVKVNKMEKELRLQVDDINMTEKEVPTPKVTRRRMYVGGILSPHKKLLNKLIPGWDFPGFDGCIGDFTINDNSYDLHDEKFSRDVLPCRSLTTSSYVHKDGYLTLAPPTYQGNVIQIGVEFRSGETDGWILTLLENRNPSTRVGLRLIAGKIVVQVVINDVEKYLHEHVEEDAPTCDGNWHHVSVTLDGEKDVFMSILDGERTSVSLEGALTTEDFKELKKLPLHVGGLTGNVIEVLGGKSLQGCFGRLQAGGADLALESARRTNKVLLNECFYKEKTDD